MRKMILSVAVLALAAAPALAGDYNKMLSAGDKAPKFAGVKAIENGKEVTLSLDDIKEDVVVVTFFANHCPVVVACEDRTIDLAKSYKGQSVKFVAICCTDDSNQLSAIDDLKAIQAKVKEKGYTFAYGYNPNGEVGKAYGAKVTPEYFVLDKTRTVQYLGAMDDSPNSESGVKKTFLKDAINAVLKGESVEVKETAARGCGISYKKN